MDRSSKLRSLVVWFNGIRVGLWSVNSRGVHEFQYVDSWLDKPESRPISLSLPLAEAGYVYRSEDVSAFFDNLLPDSSEIRQRIKIRYNTASLSAIDLLAEIGRDCVGAIQLLPESQEPSNSGSIWIFRFNPATCSGINLPGVPVLTCHPFRFKPATF